jgi:3-(3-hydroxy-phenyl)propionate hydroxylase
MAVDVDVVIVGFGPGGAVAASLLGQAGHRVLVLDKAPAPYGQPRMSTLDGEIARVLQHAADPQEAMEGSVKVPSFLMFGADDKPLPPMDWDYRIGGHWSHYTLHQPNIESAMERRIASCPSAEVRWGCRATGVEQQDDVVRVSMETGTADSAGRRAEAVTARYVLGFDGSRSFIRQAVGIELDMVHEHDDRWILTDFDALRPLPEMPTSTQLRLDPFRPWFAGPNGANRCRTNVRVMQGEDLAEELAEERGYEFIESKFGLTRADVKLTRRVTYRFRSQLARAYRAGRVFLGGDAVHAMAPYLGQGACCAMRDAANIAWKLRLVLSGAADESLLDSYEIERMPQDAFFVKASYDTWRYVNELNPEKAAQRDAEARAGLTQFPSIPGLSAGLLHRNAAGEPTAHAGHLAPQGVVRRNGAAGRLDDLIGYGGQLISSLPIEELLRPDQLSRLAELEVHVLRVGEDDVAGTVDLDGTYQEFWKSTGATTLLARADHYLFGLAASRAEVQALVSDFMEQIPAPAS